MTKTMLAVGCFIPWRAGRLDQVIFIGVTLHPHLTLLIFHPSLAGSCCGDGTDSLSAAQDLIQEAMNVIRVNPSSINDCGKMIILKLSRAMPQAWGGRGRCLTTGLLCKCGDGY